MYLKIMYISGELPQGYWSWIAHLSNQSWIITPYEVVLDQLRAECVRDVETLLSLIKALKAKKGSKRGGFGKALGSAWGREES